ncbi:MAG: polysaccharide deacetylase family protein [Imperialibacter sp.]|uniref:polysaccharide deacetylase family protein n=1 Tax=Imperialibacter sp. TaxID=2038411 RepID=UPI0032EE5F7D
MSTESKSTFLKVHHPILLLSMLVNPAINHALAQTYAEKLGWKKGDKVIMFHVDDAGMSHASNKGAIQAMTNGIATSVSVMMPCPWVSEMGQYLAENKNLDAGLHLTHTAEWTGYRWASVSGIKASPGLSDMEGVLWSNVADVVAHASANEIETEIRAQLAKARTMGFSPTHLDTHMGTLWATPDYLDRYIKVGIEEHIPILFSAGNNTLMQQALAQGPLAGLNMLANNRSGSYDTAEVLNAIRQKGKEIWDAGLVVVDDLYLLSYDWEFPSDLEASDENLRTFKTQKYKELLDSLAPGITVILIHCTDADKGFSAINDSGNTRRGDLLSMTDPELKRYVQQQGFILTTWRELQAKRDNIRN